MLVFGKVWAGIEVGMEEGTGVAVQGFECAKFGMPKDETVADRLTW